MIAAGMTPNEAIRSTGNTCSDGPVPSSIRRAWAKLPFVGAGVAHLWIRVEDFGIGRCASFCGLIGREHPGVRLLGQGNLQRCARCVAAAQKRRIA